MFGLEESEIDGTEELTQEEKDKLISFLKAQEEEQDIKITEESSEDDVKKFLEIKLKFSKKSAESLGLDGQGLLSSKEEEINNEENLTKEEKENLINYLIENNYLKPEPKPQPQPEPVKVPEEKVIKITKESSKEEVTEYLKEVCKITEKNIKLLNLDGKTIFKLTKAKIEQYKDLSKEEKETLLKFLVDNNIEIEPEPEKDIVLTKQSSKDEVAKYLKIKLKFSDKAIKSLTLNGAALFNLEEKKIKKNDNLKDEEKKKLIKLIEDNSNKYGGIEGKNIQIYNFKKYNISPLINDSNYNIFCIFSFYEIEINHIGISVYDDKREYLKLKFSEYVSYQPFIIKEFTILDSNDDKIKTFLIQIPLNKLAKNLYILYQNDSVIFESFTTKLDIPNGAKNLFYTYNLNGCTKIITGLIYKFYLNTFFGEDNQNKYQKELISTMVKTIKENDNTIKLGAETILKFFKYCAKLSLEPKSIDNIEVDIGKNALKNKLNKDYYLTNDDINHLVKKEREKAHLINLVVKIYSNYDKDMLTSLITTENGKDYVKSLFQLIRERKLKLEDLYFENKDDLILFQKNLLSSVETKDELNNVLNLSENLTACLKFISDNIQSICQVLENFKKWYKWNNYELTIQVAKNEEKIDEIYNSLLSIIQYTKPKKILNLLNLDIIFNNIVNFYANKNLEELCKIHKIASLCVKEGISVNLILNFYNIIHNKGLNLIMQNKFSPQEIVQFMKTQDIYYYHEKYYNNELRDPIIFNYIPITNKDNNYLNNIELLKKNKIWEIYSKSNYNLKKKFFEIIASQIEKIIDIKSIFDIFPIKFIDCEFTLQINKRLNNVLYLILEEKEENYNLIYDIFDKIFIVNESANLDLKYIFNLIASLNYVITSKYFFYLIKNPNLKNIFGKLKELIIEFFINQFNDKANKGQNAESVISLLILCTDNRFRLDLLNQMNKMIMKEEEFYSKEEKENYLFFKIFFEKCKDLLKIEEISTGIYLNESVLIKSKISTDLSENKIKYDNAYNLMDKENTFYKKILVIADQDEKEAKKIYDKIDESLKICEEKIKKFEIIEEFYSLFYNNTKQEIINLLKNKINELKQKNINEILDIKDEEFIINDNFNYKEAIEESKDVKYKNSLFFMSIYKKNIEEKVDKTEDEIFKETKNNYKDSLTRIINQKESKESFFKIDFVPEILSVIKNPNNNLEKEILFLEKEFADLDKENYIKNELLNDLTNFSNKNTTQNLLKYIINIIDSFKKIREDIKETEFSNTLKNTLDILSKDEVNGEEIKNAIEFLGKYEYDIKKETPITNFYGFLSGKEEAIIFIKTLKNANFEIRNLTEFMDENEQSHLQASDIDNLIDVFSFMNKIIDNKDIKTDEDFIKIFKKEFEDEKNNKDIAIKFHSYLSVFDEIIQLYQQYDENPEMTIEKVDKILKESKIEIKNKKDTDLIVFEIEYDNGKIIHSNELDELRNKLLMSSSNNRRDLSKSYIDLIDNIKQLTKTLNILLKLGYPNNLNLVFNVKNSDAVLDNDDDDDKILKLGQVVNNYKKINENFRKSIKDGYEKSPYLRLFYGKQFVSLNTQAVGKPTDISHLVNSVSSNKIKQTQIEFNYNFENSNSIQNINKFLEKLFKVNKVNIEDIYTKNQVLDNIDLKPGLYRKVKAGDYCDMIYNILNIYINITGNLPIPNTILLCNEETNIEKIKAFLYRALYCEKPIFFIIANIECLDFSVTQVMTKTLKLLYKAKNKKINSYLLFFYEKVESGLAREIERLIPEKNILSNGFMKESRQDNEELKKIFYEK